MNNHLKKTDVRTSSLNVKTGEQKELLSLPFYQRKKFGQWCEKLMTAIGTGGQILFYLQAYKIYITESAASVSLPGFSFAAFSLLCWLLYGLLIGNKVLV